MRKITSQYGMSILFLVTGLMLFIAVPAAQHQDAPNDKEIRNRIEDVLLQDAGVPGQAIDIQVQNGIAELSGATNNLLTKERAVRLAETVKGVRAVLDHIDVEMSEKSDAKIKKDVKSALKSNPATSPFSIGISVDNAVVTLSGTVSSWREKNLAGTLAKSITGVKTVTNNVDVEYQSSRSDEEIAKDVRSALRWDALIDDGLIDVSVNDGEVILSGTVGSAAEKRRAYVDGWVTGTRWVDTEKLNVEGWERSEKLRKGKYRDISDSDIKEALQDALTREPNVDRSDVGVMVSDGIATLRGKVSSLNAKRTATQVAQNTVGVWRVKNRLKVRPGQQLSDAEVTKQISQALQRTPFVEHGEVTVRVRDGKVRLGGTVDTPFEKAQAEGIVSAVAGVIQINNDIRVVGDQPGRVNNPYVDERYIYYNYSVYGNDEVEVTESDWAVQEDIEDEFWWSPFVDGDDISVVVSDGIATLTGTVDTWAERKAATENALEGGATSVVNKLSVKHGPSDLRYNR